MNDHKLYEDNFTFECKKNLGCMDLSLINRIYSIPLNIKSFDYYFIPASPLCNLLDFDIVAVTIYQFLSFHFDFMNFPLNLNFLSIYHLFLISRYFCCIEDPSYFLVLFSWYFFIHFMKVLISIYLFCLMLEFQYFSFKYTFLLMNFDEFQYIPFWKFLLILFYNQMNSKYKFYLLFEKRFQLSKWFLAYKCRIRNIVIKSCCILFKLHRLLK